VSTKKARGHPPNYDSFWNGADRAQ
jgi:hypothetical protein